MRITPEDRARLVARADAANKDLSVFCRERLLGRGSRSGSTARRRCGSCGQPGHNRVSCTAGRSGASKEHADG